MNIDEERLDKLEKTPVWSFIVLKIKVLLRFDIFALEISILCQFDEEYAHFFGILKAEGDDFEHLS